MIHKPFRNWTASLALAGLLASIPAQAAEFMRPIPATPYDSRLSGAGVLGPAAPLESASPASFDSLFMQARSFRYVPDGPSDRWQSPAETERLRSGDCEDKAVWLFDRLRRQGLSGVLLVVGRKSPRDRALHVWVELTDAGGEQWLLDPAANRRVWKTADFGKSAYKPLYAFDGVRRFQFVGERS